MPPEGSLNRRGMLGPVMSASRMPTDCPARLSATASSRRDGGFAHAALAAHHGDNLLDLVELVNLGQAGLADEGHHGAALFIGHAAELNLNILDAWQGFDSLRCIGVDLVFQGAAGGGECDGEADQAVFGAFYIVDHAQLDQVAVEFGVHDGAQGFDDFFLGGH